VPSQNQSNKLLISLISERGVSMKRVGSIGRGKCKIDFLWHYAPIKQIRDSIFQPNEQGEWRAVPFSPQHTTQHTLSLSLSLSFLLCPHCEHVHTISVNVCGALFSGLRGNKKFIDKNEESLGRMLCVFLSAH